MTAFRSHALVLTMGALLMSGVSFAQNLPQPTPMPAATPAPRDVPYPGTIRIDVDATDIERHIFRVKAAYPVRGGERLTLLYPQWLPGNHSPTGRVDFVTGLMFKANGQRVNWVRDVVDVYAFHVDVPAGVTSLEAEYQLLTGGDAGESRVVMTQEMLNLQWSRTPLYPAGHFARQIMFEPSVKLPEGWQQASALDVASTEGNTIRFKPINLDDLVDSPIFAGKHFKSVELGKTGGAPVRLNIVADRPELLEAKTEHMDAHRAMVSQGEKLFGSHHFGRYEFLLALTDRMGGIGLEHHQSSENAVPPTYFTEWEKNADTRDLLPHEYVHSWNGKFRRPADLWTPNFNVPMRDSLLWVYEGQTQYWGFVLSARTAILNKQQTLDSFAMTAAIYENRIGRIWKSLQDTTNDPPAALRRPSPFRSWQRSEDYYSEGLLVWLDVDTLIREKSKGKRSLDDFAKAFFGVNNGSYVPVTYTFEDVVAALNAIEPHDWTTFLRTRLDGYGPAPLDGITRGGYKLVYDEKPSDFMKAQEARTRTTDLSYSIGVSLNREGRVNGVMWEGPAFKLGITSGTQFVAVNNVAYDADRLKDAITAAKNGAPLAIIVRNGDRFRTITFDYKGGLRYPHLERDPGKPDMLGQILAAKK